MLVLFKRALCFSATNLCCVSPCFQWTLFYVELTSKCLHIFEGNENPNSVRKVRLILSPYALLKLISMSCGGLGRVMHPDI